MKKLILALLVVSVLPIMAFAQTEVDAWYWDTLLTPPAWHQMPLGGLDNLARCWNTGSAAGACNKVLWPINVSITADVAQWIDWQMSGTSWLWRVRKPGIYAADCITANIKSNQNVAVDYNGFDNLQYDTLGGKHSVNPVIPIWYAFSLSGAVVPTDWISATALNASDDTLWDSADLHAGLGWKLWNKIQVVNCNSACQYKDEATITLKLLCQKAWIDSLSGNFLPGLHP
jgi:hypothetical protein